ncbi:MAG: peptide chain release factor N(5)-glutamine methyltransferase [Clostridia bacterium]|nr:peptide chain release factor N(5)-glutamine methyltransferase [Clostridia bacterium]
MTVKELIEITESQLTKAGCESPAFDSLCLAQSVFGYDSSHMLLHYFDPAEQDKALMLKSLADRRSKREPLQYILGEWEFMGLRFSVGEGVLIPRADTETLCELIINHIGQNNARVLDLCAGSGAIAVSVANFCKNCRVTALEKYDEALKYLRINNERNGGRIKVMQGDVFDGPPEELSGTLFDVISCNPPYITESQMDFLSEEVKHEPHTALFGGRDGLSFYRAVSSVWKESLNAGGMMIFEIGKDQHAAVLDILAGNGFESMFTEKDLNGIIRVVGGFKSR